jgi:undecaprenyl diphosphate synthase
MIDKNLVAAPGSPDRALLDALDLTRLPRHVAVIMDGNGRWAKQRHLPRVEGHRAGAAAVRDTVETAARLGLDALTLYAFSTENWKRPKTEVSTLFTLLKEYLRKELRTLAENDIRFRVVGRSDGLDGSVRSALDLALQATAGCRGMVFSVALNYSGRAEITDAVRSLAREAAAGRLDPESIDEAAVARSLYTADLPDPDLLIRTSGEMRISNFLLWQIAYAEIHVTPVLWPDFRCRHFLEALVDYQRRERRYGGVSQADESAEAAAGLAAARTALEA